MRPTIAPEVADLLGEYLICCPRTGSRLVSRKDFHELMRRTGGLVVLPRHEWRIIPRHEGRLLVHVALLRDP